MAKLFNTCRDIYQGQGDKFLIIVIPIILAKLAISCAVVPFLLKNLHGHSKIYFVLQQMSGDSYLITLFVSSYIETWMLDTDELVGVLATFQKIFTYDTIIYAASSLGTIFFYLQYAFSLLQCLNYYHMICDSLRFAEYSDNGKAMKRVICFLGLSTVLSAHSWVRCGATLFTNVGGLSEDGKFDRISLCFDTIFLFHAIFDAVEVSVLKFIYTFILIKLSIQIKSSLAHSSEMSNRRNVPTIFIVSCLVPLVTNILYVISDVLKILASFYEIPNFNMSSAESIGSCEDEWTSYRTNIHLPITASVFLLACIIHCTTYLLCFSRLRKGICTWKCRSTADPNP